MKLSEAYEKYRKDTTTYACCERCKTAWLDDKEQYGNLYCPKCGTDTGALHRGIEDPEACGFTQIPRTAAQPFDVSCAQCATPYSRRFETTYGNEACPACGCLVYSRQQRLQNPRQVAQEETTDD